MAEGSVQPMMDGVLNGVQKTVDLLNYMVKERSQTYGTIIYLMEVLEKNSIVMPPVAAMREYHDSFYVQYIEEDGDFFLKIMSKEEEVDGEED